ncbi:hypothetical protein [Emticicia sp. W12TSBA100-4]|uniref:hypothetical protein n=1 Tax=Emticicia sp. W12TSBA100-4 TaxID=3160965 RepID=UPI003305C5FD
MKKIILSVIVVSMVTNVFAQSTLITPGNQENKNSGPDLILTSNGIPELRGQRSDGTLAAPTAVGTGSNLLQLNGFGHNGSSFIASSAIRFITSETWTSTARGSDMRFYTTKNGTTTFSEKMRLTGDGYVGIGTSSPGFLLNFPNAVGDKISLWGNTGNHYGFGIQGSLLQIHSDISSSDIAFGHGTSAAFTEKMRIKGDGSVGIGTATPLQNFVVTGDNPAMIIGHNASSHSSNSVESGRIYFDEGVNTTSGRCGFEMHYDGSTNKFEINSGCTAFVNNLTITRSTGNVGIGTANPTNKLDVNGIIRGNEVIVETGWADYVFQDDYKLKPLSEVEAFIKENKHLPSVPSAAKIQEKGAHVAELMTKMMEKIEELTLYSIEQKKEIDELKKRLDEKK